MENRPEEECELLLILLKVHCKGETKLSLPYRQKFNVYKEEGDTILALIKRGGFRTILKKSELKGYLRLIGDFDIEEVKKLSIAYTLGCSMPYGKEGVREDFYEVDFLLQ